MLSGACARGGSARWLVLVVGALGACGGDDDATSRDAAIDTPPSMCGAEAFLTGDVVDADATEARFCGVFNATLTVRGEPARTDTTSPNGRYELCIARQALTTIDVAYSPTASACTTPREAYPGRAVIVAPQNVADAGALSTARALTPTRQAALFTQIGQAYDASKAQLIVHVAGGQRAVSIAAAHATTQRFDGAAWQAGDTGTDVLFPNVAPGATEVTVAGATPATTSLTLEAGAFTYLTVRAN
jgi:hypothetical protein